ncbi:unnamed protein product, partial [Allacma fusca]
MERGLGRTCSQNNMVIRLQSGRFKIGRASKFHRDSVDSNTCFL